MLIDSIICDLNSISSFSNLSLLNTDLLTHTLPNWRGVLYFGFLFL